MSSVGLSVTLVDCDHIGWNSSQIISPSVILGCSFFATLTSRVYSNGNTRNFRPNRGGVLKKWLSAYKSSNISETRQDNNNNNNNNNTRTMFMVLSSCYSSIARVHPGSHGERSTAPGGRRPLDQAYRLEP